MMNLNGKKGLIVGIANDQSIAYGCAKAMREAGADLAITYLNHKAESHVRPLAENLDADLILPLDVREAGQIQSVFKEIERKWGKLDFLIHSIAYAPKGDLQGDLVDASRSGFLMAMDVSAYSFIEMARLARPLMKEGGALMTMSFYGATQVVDHYNLMGPAKAALECATKYLAAELGEEKIRVNAISPGPVQTRAASGLNQFDELLELAKSKSPKRELIHIDDVGAYCAFLASDAAKSVTGNIIYIDGGYHIID